MVRVFGVHAKGVVPRFQKRAHGLLERLEIADHFVPVEFVGFENELHLPIVTVRKFTQIGMLGEHVPAFDLKCFANPVRHLGKLVERGKLNVETIVIIVPAVPWNFNRSLARAAIIAFGSITFDMRLLLGTGQSG
jgi:hypothetical protein